MLPMSVDFSHRGAYDMRTVSRLTLILVLSVLTGAVNVKFQTDTIVREVDERFASVTLDTGLARINWGHLDFSSERVKTLAKALAPSYLRFGGSSADFAIFKEGPHSGHSESNSLTNFTFSSLLYDQLYQFTSSVGWDLTFDLNSLLRLNGKWDPSNANRFLKYSLQKNYVLAGLELGNEPDVYYSLNVTLTPEQLARDFKTLIQVIQEYPAFWNTQIMGPSTSQLDNRTLPFFQGFLKAGGGEVVTAVTFHQYPIYGGTATEKQFINTTNFDSLQIAVNTGTELLRKYAPAANLWLGETSSAWGGGAKGFTDTYIDGFMWLDKLGICAKYGVDVVMRQSFYGANYSLLYYDTAEPTPDYWLTLLYKRLVGRKVLNVTYTDKTGKLRLYAHCTNKRRTLYPSGSVTVYGMNLHNESVPLQFPGQYEIQSFLLEPFTPDNITSSVVMLNGIILKMKNDTTLPDLWPKIQRHPEYILPPLTFGFLVFPSADAKICQ